MDELYFYLKTHCSKHFDEILESDKKGMYYKLAWLLITKRIDNPVRINEHNYTLVRSPNIWRDMDDNVRRNYNLLLDDDEIVYESSFICD